MRPVIEAQQEIIDSSLTSVDPVILAVRRGTGPLQADPAKDDSRRDDAIARVPEKWEPVFRQGYAQNKVIGRHHRVRRSGSLGRLGQCMAPRGLEHVAQLCGAQLGKRRRGPALPTPAAWHRRKCRGRQAGI